MKNKVIFMHQIPMSLKTDSVVAVSINPEWSWILHLYFWGKQMLKFYLSGSVSDQFAFNTPVGR